MKLVVTLALIVHLTHAVVSAVEDCYDELGRAQKCVPEFVNAAFNLSVDATSICGVTSAQEFCMTTGVTGLHKSCGHQCDAQDSKYRHPPSHMTDFNNQNNPTWWQSETLFERQADWLPSREHHVNLTLSLGKAFDVTYIRLRFHSLRPESFAIYKRTTTGGPWIPYQYYSASCRATYNKAVRGYVTRENEDVALCTDKYSDISPLTGGEVAFSTLEGRPSAWGFEDSPVLQEWVTATDIRIVLTHLNTFGDEVFADPRVLRSYYYAIEDLAVGARCKCNGHAGSCSITQDRSLQCRCDHHTTGPDCNVCEPFYNDRPWARATEDDGMECLPCDCNGKTNHCYFDEELYQKTGHGGHCQDCRDNTDGVNCEHCLPQYYKDQVTNRCLPCHCHQTGSVDLQCGGDGTCRCKPGVGGDKCDRCQDNFFDLYINGCRERDCAVAGSLKNSPHRDNQTGQCSCKEFVEGRNCDRCKPGYFGLDAENPHGCVSCFCYGHSEICSSATDYSPRAILTDFDTGKQGWIGVDGSNSEVETTYNESLRNLGIAAAEDNGMVYFSAPARYLGDQRFSYNQYLSYNLRIREEQAQASTMDIIIEGAGRRISAPFSSQDNPTPGTGSQWYLFRLNEHTDYQWHPQLNAETFISILANITAIKIRAIYNANGAGFIDDIRLETAGPGRDGGVAAPWVESCTCPDGYVGQFCESCAPGYRRDLPDAGPLSSCVPYKCSSRSEQSDTDTEFLCLDKGVKGKDCTALGILMGRRLCPKLSHICCATCRSQCKNDRKIKGATKFNCKDYFQAVGGAVACAVFPYECCASCDKFYKN